MHSIDMAQFSEIVAVKRSDIVELIKSERDKCIRDVCSYCAGHCPQEEREPKGPNLAGNWTHASKADQNRVFLCSASGILARAAFESSGAKVFDTEIVDAK